MKRIRKRARLDTLLNQQRTSGAPWGRRIYVGLLAAFAVAIGNYLIGDAFIFRATGILMADRQAVDAAFPARVAAVYVRPGDSIEAGALLMKLESADMEREIADLSARNVDLSLREAQLRVDQSRVAALLPLADRWSRQAGQNVAQFDTISMKGLITSQTQNQALFSRFDAASKLAELKGQAQVLESQIPDVTRSRSRAQDALSRLEALYDRGSVYAPMAGVVGSRVPDVGHVAKTGDELMVIYGRKTYVQAYLPRYYLFGVSPGDKVELSGGPGAPSVTGVVESVLSVAEAMPDDFQSASRPRGRDRLLRISLPKSHGFALSQKLEIGGCAFGWCWRGG